MASQTMILPLTKWADILCLIWPYLTQPKLRFCKFGVEKTEVIETFLCAYIGSHVRTNTCTEPIKLDEISFGILSTQKHFSLKFILTVKVSRSTLLPIKTILRKIKCNDAILFNVMLTALGSVVATQLVTYNNIFLQFESSPTTQ